uniref:Uncharacterized protein n=1 Tax=Timema monikensis TaxID=170555 RepID=A0A7R9DXL9_9NEOP|nr:unnamed protein product [Timema monikensis]
MIHSNTEEPMAAVLVYGVALARGVDSCIGNHVTNSTITSLVLTDSSQLRADGFEKLPDQIKYPYAEPYRICKNMCLAGQPQVFKVVQTTPSKPISAASINSTAKIFKAPSQDGNQLMQHCYHTLQHHSDCQISTQECVHIS